MVSRGQTRPSAVAVTPEPVGIRELTHLVSANPEFSSFFAGSDLVLSAELLQYIRQSHCKNKISYDFFSLFFHINKKDREQPMQIKGQNMRILWCSLKIASMQLAKKLCSLWKMH